MALALQGAQQILFNPILITSIPGLRLWMDGTSGMTGNVWFDKSPSSNNATRTGGTITTTTVNGLQALSFASVRMTYANNLTFSGTTGSSCFFVVSPANANNDHLLSIRLGSDNALIWSDSNLYENIGFSSRQTISGFSLNTLQLYTNIANRSGNTVIFRDGNQVFSATYGSAYTGEFSGRVGGDTGSWTGTVCEYLVYGRTLTIAEQQQIEAYLARKWGLLGVLSIGNPYRSIGIPPQIRFNQFLPTSIPGCQIWLDAADASTFSFSSDSNVSQWRDKSGNARNFNTTSGTPTYSSSTLTIPSGAIMSSASTFPLTTNTFIFAVPRLGNTAGGIRMFIGFSDINNGGSTGDYSIRYNNAVLQIQGNNNDALVNIFVNGTLNPSLTSSSYIVNHIIAGQNQAGGTTTITLSSGFLSRFYFGNVSEVIFYSSPPSTFQRQQVEGYLALKWGVQSALPSDHPYRSIPAPSINFLSFSPLKISGCQLWLDAADSNSLSLSGSNVTQWNDKSGNGYNAVPRSLSRLPVYTKGFNGSFWTVESVTQSDFGNTLLSTMPRSNVQGTTGFSFFLVSKFTAGTVFLQYEFTGGRVISLEGSNRFDYGEPFGIFSYPAGYTALSNYILNMNLTSATSNIGFSYNGLFLSNYSVSVVTSNFTTSLGIFGRGGDLSNVPGYGQISELILYNKSFTTLEQQQIEGYLAWKWGLQGSLPATHPFKLRPPSN